MKVPSYPTLQFTVEAWAQLQGFLLLSDLEISGFGRVIRLGQSQFLVDEICILNQEVSAAGTLMKMDDVARFTYSLMERGEDPGLYRLWWHSHAKGTVYFSSTDEATIQQLNNEYLFSLVGNQKGETRLRLDIANLSLTLDEMPFGINYLTESVLDYCHAQMEEKVTEMVRTPPKGTYKPPLAGTKKPGKVALYHMGEEGELEVMHLDGGEFPDGDVFDEAYGEGYYSYYSSKGQRE